MFFKNTKEFSNVVSRIRTKNTMKHLASLVSVVEYEEDYSAARDRRSDHGHDHKEEAESTEPQAHEEGDAEQ